MAEYAVIDGQRVELTGWFPADINPLNAGAYEAERHPGIKFRWYRYWDGKRWNVGCSTPDGAVREYHLGNKMTPPYSGLQWRGLAHPPGAT